MAVTMVLPLVVSALLGLFAPWLGRRLPPATAVRFLTTAAYVTTAAVWYVLAVIGLLMVAHFSVVADLGRFSTRVIGDGIPVPLALAAFAPLLLGGLMLAALGRALLGVRDLVRATARCRRLGRPVAGLVVIDEDEPDAYSVAGLRGRVVVSTAMLRALSPDERRVLLAHESAHLAGRHHLWLQAADVAVAANPLLRPVSKAVGVAIERWADEIAAAEVGDRTLAARALARAGIARATATRAAAPATALPAASHAVADRARALLAGPPRRRRALNGVLAALMVTVAVASAATTVETATLFRSAHAAYEAQR
jgi:Zn-dependent protease with chaperone function